MSESESDDDIDSHGLIVPIQQHDVQRIVAGQVILDLSSAVKELVDNSLDAGAKSINIRLFNQGIDVIEVSDDGTGVPKASRPLLAMKHATSKILNFDDIYKDNIIDGKVQKSSLGFRGEALFSLANISQNLIVSTKTESEEMGQKLEFKKDGFLDTTKTANVSRKVGTTVAIVKLFDALPVRRVDFIKRIKQQRQKLIKLIQSYAVLCVGINFTLTDVTGAVGSSASKNEIKLSTSEKSKNIQETVSSVLGSKFCQGLCTFHLDLLPALEDMIRSGRAPESCALNGLWKIEGLVSKAPCTEVQGKVARDIQFFSVNGRPVELPTVSRLLSDVWKNFEPTTGDSSKKRPACILGLHLPSCIFDVNVSPDKREVFITEDSIIYDCIRHGLCHLWTNQQRLFNANQGEESAVDSINTKSETTSSASEDTTKGKHTPRSQPSGMRMKRRNAFINDFNSIGKVTTDNYSGNVEQIVPTSISDFQELMQLQKEDFEMDAIEEPIIFKDRNQSASNRLSNSDHRKWNQTKLTFSPGNSSSQREEIHELLIQTKTLNREEDQESPGITLRANNLASAVSLSPSRFPDETIYQSHQVHPSKNSQFSSTQCSDKDDDTIGVKRSIKRKAPDVDRHRVSDDMHENTKDENVSRKLHSDHSQDDLIWYNFSGTESILSQSKAAIASSNMRKKYFEKIQSMRSSAHNDSHQEKGIYSSGKTISLAKDDFVTMTILGQFNLGFILALCNSGHLWILDQHACDEKYNFEKLCNETRVHEQKLLAPLPLELSPSEENCVLENLDIFEQNGFKFLYDETKTIRHRLSLTTIPHNSSGGDGRTPVTFGPEDVGALCALLGADGESSSSGYIAGSGTGADGRGSSGNNAVRRHAGSVGGVIRLPKSIALFASRACRSSVMIGEALSKNKMDEIVKRLRELEQPWTCAHGRPTIRHIRDILDDLLDDENI